MSRRILRKQMEVAPSGSGEVLITRNYVPQEEGSQWPLRPQQQEAGQMKELKVLRIKTDCGACVNKCCTQPYDWVYLTSQESSRLGDASGVPEKEFMATRPSANTGFVVATL